MVVSEESQFTRDYYDPDQRAIGNAVQVFFQDGSCTEQVTVCFPLGHRRRRRETIPLLLQKFRDAVNGHFPPRQAEAITDLCQRPQDLAALSVDKFLDLLVAPAANSGTASV